MIIDSHCHAGNFSPLFAGDHVPADLLTAHGEAGVDAAMLSILNRDNMAEANDRTRHACERSEGRLYGHLYLNPHSVAGALQEIDRCSQLECFRGVKLHPSEDAWFPYMKQYFPIYARLEELGLPILFHSGTHPHSNPLAIAYAAKHFPGIPFILGHFGLADLSWECFPAADLSENVYVDTTANPMVRVMSEWLNIFGADRMLWGSDFPFYNVRYELAKLDFLGVSGPMRERILGANARRIFRL
ncbi:MAG TPA: amidohydrolase family protein [Gemmatimonadales bacterium]|nr:amidohydrolase family protein [Gemmatimonadales bacterium]